MVNEDGTREPYRPGRRENRPGQGDRPRGDRNQRGGRGKPGERGRPRRGGDRFDRRERDSGEAPFRILSELSVLEKALSTGDFAKQKQPLEEILKALRPLRLRSLEDLDFNTRGRLLTTLLRVSRQKKPPEPPPAPAAELPPTPEAETQAMPAAEPPPAPEAEAQAAPAAEPPPTPGAEAQAAPAAEPPPTPGAETQAMPEAEPPPRPESEPQAMPEALDRGRAPEQAESKSAAAKASEGTSSSETAASDVPSPAPQPPSAAEAAAQARPRSPEEEKLAAYREVMFLVGSVWKAAGDEQRAEVAFAASGRRFQEHEPVKTPRASADWREEARLWESQKRTRDAARLHERHESHTEAARLYEMGGDLKSALRCLLAAKDLLPARRLLKHLKPEQFLPIIERAGAYELLMEHYVDARDFDNVAKLYERARQFDQAAIAWEKGGKLAAARKSYERAKDAASAERVRQLEVAKLIERGDRLGAAVLLLAAGKREEATQTLLGLPSAKAFRFLQKVKLDAEALELARSEIVRAEAENKPAVSARWLEMLGDAPAAAEAWERAARKDRALPLYEEAGNWQRAAELAEELGHRDKAVELYHRAGDRASAERVAALPAQVAAPPTSGSPVPLEGQGEEG